MKPIKENEGLLAQIETMNKMKEDMFLACGIPKKYIIPSGNTNLFIGSEDGAKVMKNIYNDDTLREE